jgi:hypothetical protein
MQWIAPCLVLALWLNSGAVEAVPVTFNFTGTVTQSNFDPSDPFAGTIAPNTSFSGSYTFDSTVLDSIPLDLQNASYQHAGPPYGANVTIGGNPFSTNDSLAVNVTNGSPPNEDFYGVLACSPDLSSCTIGPLTIELSLRDLDGTTFLTDASPLVPPPLANFEIRDFHLIRNTFDEFGSLVEQVQIDGEITSLTLAPANGGNQIPAPDVLWLLGTALAALGWQCRSRR